MGDKLPNKSSTAGGQRGDKAADRRWEIDKGRLSRRRTPPPPRRHVRLAGEGGEDRGAQVTPSADTYIKKTNDEHNIFQELSKSVEFIHQKERIFPTKPPQIPRNTIYIK